jgi:hypothetical protein
MPLRARNLLGGSAGCHQMRMRITMTDMAVVYRRPVGAVRLSVEPQLASWDRAGHPSQVKLGGFLAHVDAVAGRMLATVSGPVAAKLIIVFRGDVSLIGGGRDLDNYLFPVAQRLGPERVAAIFGRKIHGPSSLAVGPVQPDMAEATRSSRSAWRGPMSARSGNKRSTIGLRSKLGEDPIRPFHPHDDHIVSLGLYHTIDTSVTHEVIMDAWWTSL